MKTRTKALLLTICAVLLVAVSVFSTIAFLKASDNVVNTFTVGKVAITLDEVKVDQYGNTTSTDRVKTNQYKLIPSHSYTKDPTVHFLAGSEASYLFVKVENGIEDIESGTTIHQQILANGWTELTGQQGVYYKLVDATESDVDYIVFESFTIAEEADVADYSTATISITAYAIQADGFEGNPALAFSKLAE
ncbi:MAG: hypothetical protein ACI4WG_03655 [Erysipelotrichaceae bacterium]